MKVATSWRGNYERPSLWRSAARVAPRPAPRRSVCVWDRQIEPRASQLVNHLHEEKIQR